MANIIDLGAFRRGNVVETTTNIIKEEANMNTIQTIGTIADNQHLQTSVQR